MVSGEREDSRGSNALGEGRASGGEKTNKYRGRRLLQRKGERGKTRDGVLGLSRVWLGIQKLKLRYKSSM